MKEMKNKPTQQNNFDEASFYNSVEAYYMLAKHILDKGGLVDTSEGTIAERYIRCLRSPASDSANAYKELSPFEKLINGLANVNCLAGGFRSLEELLKKELTSHFIECLQPGYEMDLIAEHIAQETGSNAEYVLEDFHLKLNQVLADMYYEGSRTGYLQDFGQIQYAEGPMENLHFNLVKSLRKYLNGMKRAE